MIIRPHLFRQERTRSKKMRFHLNIQCCRYRCLKMRVVSPKMFENSADSLRLSDWTVLVVGLLNLRVAHRSVRLYNDNSLIQKPCPPDVCSTCVPRHGPHALCAMSCGATSSASHITQAYAAACHSDRVPYYPGSVEYGEAASRDWFVTQSIRAIILISIGR